MALPAPGVASEKRKQRENARRAQEGSKAASRTITALNFLIPAIAGFGVAYGILDLMGPFTSFAMLAVWVVIALAISLGISLFVGDFVRNLIQRTPLYKMANKFDTEVEELFGKALREGNPKVVRRNAIEHGHDPGFVDEVIDLLDQLADHERLTRGHNERVRAYASMIGREIGLDDEDLEALNWTALMHDIGKLDVPSWLLSSPDKPTDEEWEVLQRHPEMARHRLRKLEKTLGDRIYEGALYHHERWDGEGYPHGLAGKEIPLFGRITAIADAFDVMTHARSYQKPRPIADAREELIASAGSHFDPQLVAAFLKIGDEEVKDVRGWSATFAGVALVGSRVATIGSQVAIVAASVTGAAVAAGPVEEAPPAIAFEAPAETTTTTTEAPETTTTAAPTTTEAEPAPTTTVAETTTTTTTARRQLTINYEISTNTVDGVQVTVEADELQVFLDGELYQTIELGEERTVPVVFDVTNLEAGVHKVQFDLYLDGTKISSDQSALVV